MNMYQNLYDIILNYVFGGVVPNDFQEVAIEIFCLGAWLFCLAIPFVVVIWFIKLLGAAISRIFS